MKNPLVTISLVVFNQENYLRQTIESCLIQKVNFPYEIIIHDDNSTDNSAKIILEYAKAYPDIIIPVLQTENQFSQGTEIIAEFILPKAKGKYMAFIEGDDYWIDPLKLQTQIDFLETNPEIVMCFTATKQTYPENTKEPTIKRYAKQDALCSIRDVIRLGGNLVDMVSVVTRSSIFEDLPDWYYFAQTWDLTVPLLSLLHGKIQYLNQVTAVYRNNVPGSWTQKNVRMLDRRKRNRMKSIKVTDGFDRHTNQKYHKYAKRKNDPLIVEVLLLSKAIDEEFSTLYPRLTLIPRIEYRLFKLINSLRLWEIYRYFRRMFTGY